MNLQHWTAETDDEGIVWLRIDKADANANVLSSEVMTELDTLMEFYASAPPKGLVIHSGKRNGFIMGADINEFTSVDSPRRAYEVTRLGQQVFDKLEGLRCKTVAVINGFALGGGLELAMACDYRLALANDKPVLGLPEVQLGLHPGFGGTVRAVQICGVRQGMQLMLTGKPITVDKGRKIGLVDRIAAVDNWRQAARELIAASRPKHTASVVEQILNLGIIRPFIKPALIRQVAGKARRDHYPAPYAIIELWARHGASTRTGYEAEARSFSELMCSPTSRNLVRVFFLQNRLKSQGGKTDREIAKVHVVGAGVMGGDIASWCALRGMQVTLQDREQKFVEPAIARAQKLFAKRIRNATERAAATQRLQMDIEGEGVADADLIIEAIFEDVEAKKNLYKRLESTMRPDVVLATNTSTIPLEQLRNDLREPTRFIGLHFFNPVSQMPLVEVVRCGDTEQQSLDIGFAFVKSIGKLPLECMSAPGFVVNRVLAPYMIEAMHLVASGISLTTVDRVAEQFGMPMGPVELADSVGLDVVLHSSRQLGANGDGPTLENLAAMVERGHLGRKTGQGFYAWQDGKAVKPSTGADSLPPDIEDRLILPMVNEAVACLADGVVSDADLLDAGVIFGTGFAPFRGGPVNYARERGFDAVVNRMHELAGKYGDRFEPHTGWSTLKAE
jgi:3-hydroxyacyl-CoA dehydrogenase/enoyl-CoA hydratase/3-hydroxybutyryl-CoA epimerase